MDTNIFVESMSFEVVIAWANLLNVEHHEESWLRDEYCEKENDLRVRLATAMRQVGADA